MTGSRRLALFYIIKCQMNRMNWNESSPWLCSDDSTINIDIGIANIIIIIIVVIIILFAQNNKNT